LKIHWGPIICLDGSSSTAWSMPNPIDAQRYPRKFSNGGLSGGTYTRAGLTPGLGPVSDQQEYWAYAAMTPPPIIDELTYIQLAKNESMSITPPVSKISGSPIAATGCAGGNPNCGYFVTTTGDTAVFGSGYSLSGGPVVYVEGSAEFGQIAIDSAAVIVTGALTVNNTSGGATLNLHVPSTAPSEYPYDASAQPCQGKEGNTQADSVPLYDCASTTLFSDPIQFRGFLYVKGNFVVDAVGWSMVGALQVGDRGVLPGTGGVLVIPGPTGATNASLNLVYDDAINHSIFVNPVSGTQIRVEPDLLQAIPTF